MGEGYWGWLWEDECDECLSAADGAAGAVSGLVEVLRQLSGLAAAGLAHHHHDVVLADNVQEVIADAVHCGKRGGGGEGGVCRIRSDPIRSDPIRPGQPLGEGATE